MGIALASGKSVVKPLPHVHASGPEWTITSKVSIDKVAEVDILNRVLPGLLGRYIYPKDAVLHCPEDNVDRLMNENYVPLETTGGMSGHHLTLAVPTDDADDADAADECSSVTSSESASDDDAETEDVCDEGLAIDEPWVSDDDQETVE